MKDENVEHEWISPHRVARRATSRALKQRLGLDTSCARGLAAVRLGYVASEVGARFVREYHDVEPIQWLMSSHRLFDGRTALSACQEPEGFRRAIVLHGLGLGLDAEPMHLEGIPAHQFLSHVARSYIGPAPPIDTHQADRWEHGPLALYTCAISATLDLGHVQIFCAMLARSPVEVRFRLRRRYGPLLEDEAKVRLGFDWSEPMACAMVSEAMAHLLSLVAEDPSSTLAEGLDFQVEQRFTG